MHKNIILFINGSVGDFLMSIFFMENVNMNRNINCFIITPKLGKLFREIAEKYSYINVVEINKRNPLSLLSVFRFILSRNITLTSPTPGILPNFLKIFAKLISLSFGSKLVGFDDHRKINWIYTKLLPYDTSIPYTETMQTLLKEAGFKIIKSNPTYSFNEDISVLKKYSIKNKYLVIHPRGSDEKRSLKNEDLEWIVNEVNKKYPDLSVVLTGSSKDRDDIKVEESKNVLNLAGKLNISELATVLSNSHLYFGVDTGISHLASFIGVKSVVFSHVATISNWLPYYNKNAKVIFKVINSDEEVYEGREFLERNCWGKVCLSMPPKEVLLEKVINNL